MRSIRRRAGWSMVAKKSGSRHRHAQHRHLQAREPDADRGGNARLRSGCSGTAGRRSRSSPARPASPRPASAPACAACSSSSSCGRADRRCTAAARHRQTARNALLRLADRRAQAGRCRRWLSRGIAEAGQMTAHQPVQPADHRFGRIRAANQAAGARHHAGLVADSVRTSVSGPRRRASSAQAGHRRRRPDPHLGLRTRYESRGCSEAANGPPHWSGRRRASTPLLDRLARRPTMDRSRRSSPDPRLRPADQRPQVDLGHARRAAAASGSCRGRPPGRRPTAPRAAPAAAHASRPGSTSPRNQDVVTGAPAPAGAGCRSPRAPHGARGN